MLLGGDSIRAGLIFSVVSFLILAAPYGIRYFIKNQIILLNAFIFAVILLLYGFSKIIYNGGDDVRFLLSLILLLLMSIASLFFVATFQKFDDKIFHKLVFFGFYFLLFLGYLVLALMVLLRREPKNMFIFTEPSHYAIVFMPFLFYVVFKSGRLASTFYIFLSLALALQIKSLTLLVGTIIVIIITNGKKLWSILSITLFLVVMQLTFGLNYFSERLNFTTDNNNLSTLVFISGWERAYLSIIDTYGLGLGFQQLGIVGPEGQVMGTIKFILDGVALNINDGGSLGSKIIAETGLFGFLLLLLYLNFLVIVVNRLVYRKILGPKNVFFHGVYLIFSIELFVRGMGYFSLTSFLFICSIYWIYRMKNEYNKIHYTI